MRRSVGPRRLQKGWVKIWRSVFEHDLWTCWPDSWLRVFLAILGLANHEPSTWTSGAISLAVPAGSIVIGTIGFATFCRVSRQQLRGALKNLEREQMITTSATSNYTIVSVVNWSRYQGKGDVDSQDSEQSTRGIDAEHARNTTTKKEGKKVRSKETSLHPAVARVAGEIWARHPLPRRDIGVEAVQKKLATIFRGYPAQTVDAAAEQINRNHAGWCATFDWTHDGGQFSKGLGNWLAPTMGRFEAVPPKGAAAPAQPRQAMLMREDGL